ncbi:SLBB domain-containing protein [Rubrivirga sp. IMCC45206]|uniref:SLBB domain-containing protein n=1 Tax=Rubrivirga sp. IMCC45206 TaxID=3391614 RepID=UPI00398FFE04
MRALLVLAALAAATLSPADAQTSDGGVLGVIEGRTATPGGYYVNAREGEPVTRVHVWGRVLRPGIYDVGPGFGLASVLTLAGVTNERAQRPGDPSLVLRVYRAGQAGPVYEATLAAFVRDAAKPALQYGDIVEVDAEGAAEVAVWGDVTVPGVFAVPPGTTAREALAMAGGPAATRLRAAETREATVRIYREGAGEGQAAFETTLEAFMSQATPLVQDGDVIEVETRVDSGWTSRDTFTVVGLVTSGAIAVVQFLRLINVD